MTREQLAQLLSSEDHAHLASGVDVLNEPELEVFSMLSQGYTAKQIEDQFGMHPKRIAELKQSMQKKLGLKNDLELLRYIAQQRR